MATGWLEEGLVKAIHGVSNDQLFVSFKFLEGHLCRFSLLQEPSTDRLVDVLNNVIEGRVSDVKGLKHGSSLNRLNSRDSLKQLSRIKRNRAVVT